ALHRWPACSAEPVLAAVNLTVRGVAITSTLYLFVSGPKGGLQFVSGSVRGTSSSTKSTPACITLRTLTIVGLPLLENLLPALIHNHLRRVRRASADTVTHAPPKTLFGHRDKTNSPWMQSSKFQHASGQIVGPGRCRPCRAALRPS
ncbi:hypothetical protein HaLaN_25032, partial [Haematococcus lacustris]